MELNKRAGRAIEKKNKRECQMNARWKKKNAVFNSVLHAE
jgi:hypothetical protein